MKLLFSGGDLGWLASAVRSSGHEASACDWSPAALAQPAVSPYAFGRELVTAARGQTPDALIIGRGWDASVPVADIAPRFWHILPDTLRQVREAGAVIVMLDFSAPDSLALALQTGQYVWVDAWGATGGLATIGIVARWNPRAILQGFERPSNDATYPERTAAAVVALVNAALRKRADEKAAQRCCK